MKSFDAELNLFVLKDDFDNNIDQNGNLLLSTNPVEINQKYMAYSLTNVIYNNSKVKSLYDVEFKEFVNNSNIESTPVVVNSDDSNVLREQLNALVVDRNELENLKIKLDADRTMIIELRIKLGEGKVESDFSSEFPYLPI